MQQEVGSQDTEGNYELNARNATTFRESLKTKRLPLILYFAKFKTI